MAGIARTLVVTIDGVEHKVRTNPGDFHAWVERRGAEPTPDEEYTYDDLLWLAWHVCVRLELTTLELDEFIRKGLDDLEVPKPGR